MLCKQLVCWCNQKRVIFASAKSVEANASGSFEQAQESGLCFTSTCIVGIDDQWLFRIVSTPLVEQRRSPRWKSVGRGILAQPHLFILCRQSEGEHDEHFLLFNLLDNIHTIAH